MMEEGYWLFREWSIIVKNPKYVMDVINISIRNESQYYLLLSSEENIPQHSLVGEFRHYDDSAFRFYIVLDNKQVEKAKYREMCVSMRKDGNGQECGVAYITNTMLIKLQRRDFNISAIWHELGHVHNEDFDCLNILQVDEFHKLRKLCIREGKVMGNELSADEFACRLIGKRNMLKFLESAVQEREQFGDNNSEMAIKELGLRIAHLKTYRVDK